MKESGWLIEQKVGANSIYLVELVAPKTRPGRREWSHDANEAIRFARKVDADRAITWLGLERDHATATEHGFG